MIFFNKLWLSVTKHLDVWSQNNLKKISTSKFSEKRSKSLIEQIFSKDLLKRLN